MKWKDLKVRTKIIISFIIPLIMIGIIGVWTYESSRNIFEDAEHLRDESVVFAGIAEQMGKDVIQIQQWLTDISATRGLDGLNDGFDEAEKSYQSFLSGLNRFENMFKNENHKKGIKQTDELKTRIDKYYDMGKKMARGYVDGGPEVGNKMMADFDSAAEGISASIEPFVEEQVNEMGTKVGEIISSVKNLKTGVLTIFFVSVVFVILSGLFLTRSVTGPLEKAMTLTRYLAEGDLRKQVDLNQKDEFGQLLVTEQSMIENLKRIVGEIIEVAGTVSNNSKGLSSTVAQINTGIKEQSDQLEHSYTATTEVSHTVMEVAKGAAEASDSARESVTIANEGKTVVEQTVSSVMKIAENIEMSSATIGSLGESRKKLEILRT